MNQRLFRYADLCANKYDIALAEDAPAPSKLIESQKNKLKDLYYNFFSQEAEQATQGGTIPMHALFIMRNKLEPYVNKLFDKMNDLIANIDELNVVQLFKKVNGLLLLANEATPDKVEDYFIKGYKLESRSSKEDRRQYIVGYKNRMKSITRRLKEVRDTLKHFIPESETKKPQGEMVDYPASSISEHLIRRFLLSPAADRYQLTFDNWDLLRTDPRFRLRLANLLHTWERNNFVWKSDLIKDLDEIIKEFNSRKETSEQFLESGETFAPSTPTSVAPDTINLFDKK